MENEDLQELEEKEEIEENNENEEFESQEIDYSSILEEMSGTITSLESEVQVLSVQVDDLIEAQNGLLQNTYWLVYFGFAFFIMGALILVIKFFKQFF